MFFLKKIRTCFSSHAKAYSRHDASNQQNVGKKKYIKMSFNLIKN